MEPLISRPVEVRWDAAPEAVAAAIRQAIEEARYDDGGFERRSFWSIRGSVEGLALNLLMKTHSAPGSLNVYPLMLDVRGTLVANGSGTRLVGRAATACWQWERPMMFGMAAFFGLPMLLFGIPGGVIACLVVVAATILLWLALIRLADRAVLEAAPDAVAVIERAGTPSPAEALAGATA